MALNHSRLRLVIPFSFATVVVAAVAASVALGASASTSALLLLLGAAPLGVALIIGRGSAGPTVAEVLYVVDTCEGQ